MWFGIIGSEETMIIYPSTPFDVILHSFRGITLCIDSNIYWNQYNQLILVRDEIVTGSFMYRNRNCNAIV